MIYLLVRHRVVDYARWKEAFDMHLAARQAGGATHETLILHNVDEPTEVIVLLGWRDLVQARLFVQSVSWQMMKHEMRDEGSLEVFFLERVSEALPPSVNPPQIT